MKVLAVIALLGLVAAVHSVSFNNVVQKEWETFKATHQKVYEEKEEEFRRGVFADNKKKVAEHNKRFAQGEVSFKLGMNKYADLQAEEFARVMNGYKRSNRTKGIAYIPQSAEIGLPDTVDWRTKGAVTGVKDQGQCGSCWAFSTTGSLEGQHFLSTGDLVSLSEQNLVDCSKLNSGCNGGFMDYAFDYVKLHDGIDTEASYPYTARDGTCRFNKANVGATLSGHVDIPSKNEDALHSASATIGPISVAIDASHESFQLYSGGVYYEPRCSQTRLDHGVLVVGYGTDRGQDYWLVKNSWGASWGEEGYIKMARNRDNNCGIATEACYPTV